MVTLLSTIASVVIAQQGITSNIQGMQWLAGGFEGKSGPVLVEMGLSRMSNSQMTGFLRVGSGGEGAGTRFLTLKQNGKTVELLVLDGDPSKSINVHTYSLIDAPANGLVFKCSNVGFPQFIKFNRQNDGGVQVVLTGPLPRQTGSSDAVPVVKVVATLKKS